MKKRQIQNIVIVLCFLEILVGLTEIGLAAAYLFGASTLVETPKGAVAAMTVVYSFFVAVLFWSLCAMVRAGRKGLNVPKVNIIAVLAITFVLAVFMFVQITAGLITRYDESYFLLSLSWNLPRLLLDTISVIFCFLYKRKLRQD